MAVRPSWDEQFFYCEKPQPVGAINRVRKCH